MWTYVVCLVPRAVHDPSHLPLSKWLFRGNHTHGLLIGVASHLVTAAPKHHVNGGQIQHFA
jgi:hypothetical protein